MGSHTVARFSDALVAACILVVLGGLLLAPIPASFAGQGEAIRRALEVIPFIVLIATYGLEHFWTATRDTARA